MKNDTILHGVQEVLRQGKILLGSLGDVSYTQQAARLARTCSRAVLHLHAPGGRRDGELHRSHRARQIRNDALPRRPALCRLPGGGATTNSPATRGAADSVSNLTGRLLNTRHPAGSSPAARTIPTHVLGCHGCPSRLRCGTLTKSRHLKNAGWSAGREG